MTISDHEFSFSSPVPENLRQESQDTSQSTSTSMIVNDNIEDRKQDDALNYSSLEFQGEEEEVQEHSQSLSITEPDKGLNTWRKPARITSALSAFESTLILPVEPIHHCMLPPPSRHTAVTESLPLFPRALGGHLVPSNSLSTLIVTGPVTSASL